PVHKPVSGKRTVLPRAMSGPRVPAGQPVNRNLPVSGQETQQAQAHTQLQNAQAAQNVPTGIVPASAGSGQEALNASAARQKDAQLAPGVPAPGMDLADKTKAGG
ncbi:MAG: hypothetical protein FWH34_08480, partial [Desulfovibrionaceae bacterium]|nr:hypothetical protein [Desulfovibrionaceae bacterium]